MEIALNIPSNLPSGVPTGGLGSVPAILRALIGVLIIGGVLYALWQIVMSALSIIFSRGEKERLQKAQNKLRFAVVGLIAIFLGFVILNLFGAFIGVPLI